jgi:hypothetical protein
VCPDNSTDLPRMAPKYPMTGILVHGDNHFIVRGPLPGRQVANELVRHWSLIQIGAATPAALARWHIVTREFRENLEWAVVTSEDAEISPAVTQLLDELSARGIAIHRYGRGS